MKEDFCRIVGLVGLFLEKHPANGADRLRSFMSEEPFFWDTQDVLAFTGWGVTTLSNKLSQGKLPYIPGKPNRFIPAEVKAACLAMQIGGQYGRRKSKTNTARRN